MSTQFLKKSFFPQLMGISATAKPEIEGCWDYADGKLIVDLGKTMEPKTLGGAIRLEGKSSKAGSRCLRRRRRRIIGDRSIVHI